MNNTDWLQRLKAGDGAILTRGRGEKEVVTVTKLTKTQIVIGEKSRALRFRRDNGRQIGGDKWHNVDLGPYDEAPAAVIATHRAQDRLKAMLQSVRRESLQHLTRAQCHEVCAVLVKYGIVPEQKSKEQKNA